MPILRASKLQFCASAGAGVSTQTSMPTSRVVPRRNDLIIVVALRERVNETRPINASRIIGGADLGQVGGQCFEQKAVRCPGPGHVSYFER